MCNRKRGRLSVETACLFCQKFSEILTEMSKKQAEIDL